MTIIALQGDPEVGKTSTIGKLYSIMKVERRYSVFQDKKRPGSHDFFMIFEIKGKKIGISSYGDSTKLIVGKLDYFRDKGCEIMVTACRKTGAMHDCVTRYPGFDKIFIDKDDISGQQNQLEAIERIANDILDRIIELI